MCRLPRMLAEQNGHAIRLPPCACYVPGSAEIIYTANRLQVCKCISMRS